MSCINEEEYIKMVKDHEWKAREKAYDKGLNYDEDDDEDYIDEKD